MTLNLIAALASNRALGKNNKLLWHIPEDLKHFKQTTMGSPIVMGRKTFASIGRILPGRENIVLTRDKNFSFEGITVLHDPQKILARAKTEEIFIIGGGELYRHFLSHADKLFLTFVEKDFEGDVFFPVIDWKIDFKVIAESPRQHSEKDKLDFRFATAERIRL